MPSLEYPLLMFMALFTLYSPLATVSAYFPIVSKLRPAEQLRLALGVFTSVSIFAMTALWVGEPLLTLLGITTDALTVTGGIALIFVGVPLMRGVSEGPPTAPERPPTSRGGETGEDAEANPGARAESWRSLLFMPTTFPLTVGGTTFAILVSFRSQARGLPDVIALSVAGLAYATITGLTVYLSGHIERRVTPRARAFLERIAGILLTAIAVSLLARGIPRMVVAALKATEI